ncbi:MAG TPA: hypothetical protein VHS31_02100, partial [Tepidisphaeraceae bacterium]|nr:hypothetical protein [Tepidisphaeraceae bacterium]
LGDLILGAEAHLNEHFAEEFLVIAATLLFKRALKLIRLDEVFIKQELAERFAGGGDHGVV